MANLTFANIGSTRRALRNAVFIEWKHASIRMAGGKPEKWVDTELAESPKAAHFVRPTAFATSSR